MVHMKKESGLYDINLMRALEVFSTVVETRQVTRAAAMLGITQSAASQHLKNLEQVLGARLIDRRSRPIELTRAGTVLYRRTVSVLAELEELRADVRRATDAPLPALRIAMLASIATTLSPALTALARDSYRIPELTLYAGLASDHQAQLRNRQVDLAVTSDVSFDFEGFDWYEVLREQFLLITPQGYDGPLGDLEALAADLPLIRMSRNTPVGMHTDQHLSRVRLQLPRTIEGDRASLVVAPVAAGQGFALLTPTLLIDAIAEGMRFDAHKLPIAGFSRQIVLVSRERELGDLPGRFAAKATETLIGAVHRLLPNLPPTSLQPPASE